MKKIKFEISITLKKNSTEPLLKLTPEEDDVVPESDVCISTIKNIPQKILSIDVNSDKFSS